MAAVSSEVGQHKPAQYMWLTNIITWGGLCLPELRATVKSNETLQDCASVCRHQHVQQAFNHMA